MSLQVFFVRVALVFTLVFVAMAASGCCQLLDGACACFNCLLNGPDLPTLLAPPDVTSTLDHVLPASPIQGAVPMAY
jgi:hypothetical protein